MKITTANLPPKYGNYAVMVLLRLPPLVDSFPPEVADVFKANHGMIFERTPRLYVGMLWVLDRNAYFEFENSQLLPVLRNFSNVKMDGIMVSDVSMLKDQLSREMWMAAITTGNKSWRLSDNERMLVQFRLDTLYSLLPPTRLPGGTETITAKKQMDTQQTIARMIANKKPFHFDGKKVVAAELSFDDRFQWMHKHLGYGYRLDWTAAERARIENGELYIMRLYLDLDGRPLPSHVNANQAFVALQFDVHPDHTDIKVLVNKGRPNPSGNIPSGFGIPKTLPYNEVGGDLLRKIAGVQAKTVDTYL